MPPGHDDVDGLRRLAQRRDVLVVALGVRAGEGVPVGVALDLQRVEQHRTAVHQLAHRLDRLQQVGGRALDEVAPQVGLVLVQAVLLTCSTTDSGIARCARW